jgi:hypothetical protein
MLRLVVGLALATPITLAAPQLSPAASALIAPVHEAYERVERAQAALPPPKDDAAKLERLLALDQAGRQALDKIDFTVLPESERSSARGAAWNEINQHDLADQTALKAMQPAQGWFTKSKYGDKALEGAFLIVQHAMNDMNWMHDVLKRIEPLVAQGEFPGRYYALLYDRLALYYDGKLQRYGSQVTCKDHRWAVDRLEDPEHVNERRKAVGLSTLEDYEKLFADKPRCG